MKSPHFYLFLFTFILSAYMPKNIDITNFEYSRYVKPQLKSIVQDYKTLIIGLSPALKIYKSSFKLQMELYSIEYKLPTQCSKSKGQNCKPFYDQLAKNLSALTDQINQNIDLKKVTYLTIEQKIKAKNKKEQFKIQLIRIRDYIQQLKLSSDFDDKNLFNTKSLKQKILNTISSLDEYLLSLADPRFKKELIDYHSSFIAPTIKHILLRDNKEVFIQNINEFNIRLNAIAMRITKFNIPVEKRVKTLIKIIHNRWNNILKVSLITHKL